MAMMPNRKGLQMLVADAIKRDVEKRAINNGSKIVSATYADILKYCLSLTENDNDMITLTACCKVWNMTKKPQTDSVSEQNPNWAEKDNLRSVHSVRAFVCTDYKKSVQVNNPNFVPDDRPWGKKISDALSAHFGEDEILKLYMPIKLNYKIGNPYISSYYTNIRTGEIIDPNTVTPYIRPTDYDKVAEHQGVNVNEVVKYKEYTVTNILYLACHKMVFDLVGNKD